MSQYYVPFWFGDSQQKGPDHGGMQDGYYQDSKPRESHYQHANRARVLERRSAFIFVGALATEAR